MRARVKAVNISVGLIKGMLGAKLVQRVADALAVGKEEGTEGRDRLLTCELSGGVPDPQGQTDEGRDCRKQQQEIDSSLLPSSFRCVPTLSSWGGSRWGDYFTTVSDL